MKHTEGPWIITSTQDHKSALIKGDEHVATVDLDQNQDGEANAHLIAAAPELLEACERFIKFFEQIKNAYQYESSMILQFRSAIAKAKEI